MHLDDASWHHDALAESAHRTSDGARRVTILDGPPVEEGRRQEPLARRRRSTWCCFGGGGGGSAGGEWRAARRSHRGLVHLLMTWSTGSGGTGTPFAETVLGGGTNLWVRSVSPPLRPDLDALGLPLPASALRLFACRRRGERGEGEPPPVGCVQDGELGGSILRRLCVVIVVAVATAFSDSRVLGSSSLLRPRSAELA